MDKIGTGKTSTIVEIVLQLYTHTKKRILIATQSNSAADLLATRLLHSNRTAMEQDMLRLASHTAMARHETPEALRNCTKRIRRPNTRGTDGDTITVQSMKELRIVVTTCLAIGTVDERQMGRGHFHAAIIDEGVCD